MALPKSHCVDCGIKTSTYYSIRCCHCSYKFRIGKNNGHWKGGITKPRCRQCKKIITYRADCCSKCVDKNGKNNPKWRGGRPKTHEGYVQIYQPNHPYKNHYGYILEHRLVMEKSIGRYLERTEVVHHINKIRDDNRIKNLILFKNGSEHQKHHAKERENGTTSTKTRSKRKTS